MGLDGNDNPHIVYEDIYNFRYMGYRGGIQTSGVYPDGWNSPVLLDSGGAALPGTGMYPSIALDSQGNAHVTCYQDLFYGSVGGALRYVYGAGVGLPAGPDIEVSVDYNSFATEWTPGQTVQVPVTLTNIGLLPALGASSLELWYSDDGQVGNDSPLAAATMTLNLAPGQSKVFKVSCTISANEPAGPYTLVAKCIPASAMGELNLDNNALVISGGVSWKMGSFADRRNFALTVPDSQGVPVTFSLKGGGYGYVQDGNFSAIELYDTNSASVFSITSKAKGAEISVGRIEVCGSLASLVAPTTNLRVSLEVYGSVSSLTLNDVDASHTIRINSHKWSVDPKLQCAIVMDRVNQCNLETNGVPVKSLTVTEWLGDDSDIQAPWIGTLLVKGDPKASPVIPGDFEASMQLSGEGNSKLALGSASIRGNLHRAEWSIVGAIGTVSVGRMVEETGIGLDGKLTGLKSFRAAEYVNNRVQVAWSGDLFAVGRWSDAGLKVNTLKSFTAGEFTMGELVVTGENVPDGTVVLGKAVVGNIADSYYDPNGLGWDINGEVGAIVAGDITKWSMRARGVKSLTLGHVVDSAIEMDGTNSLTVAGWDRGSIEAHGIGAMKTTDKTGVFNVDVSLDNSDPDRTTLGSVYLAGDLGVDAPDTSEWRVAGTVGTVAVKGRVYHWNLKGLSSLKSVKTGSVLDATVEVQGSIGSVQAFSWDTGRIEGGVIGSVNVTGEKKSGIAGNFSNAEIIGTGQGAQAGKPVIGKVSVLAQALTIKAAGSIGDVIFGHMLDSQLLLGSSGLNAGNASDFSDGAGGTCQHTLKSLSLLGYVSKPGVHEEYFNHSSVGAWSIGTVKFAKQPSAASGRIECSTLGTIVNSPLPSSPPDPFEIVMV